MYLQIVIMVSFKFNQVQIFNASAMVIHRKSMQDQLIHVPTISTLSAYK